MPPPGSLRAAPYAIAVHEEGLLPATEEAELGVGQRFLSARSIKCLPWLSEEP